MKRQVPFKRKFPVTGLRSSNSRLHFQTAKEIASSACICVITIQWFPSFWERKMQCCLDQFPLCLLPYLLQVNRFSRQLNIVSVSWTGEKWPDNFATGEKSRAKDKISLLNCVLFVCVCVCVCRHVRCSSLALYWGTYARSCDKGNICLIIRETHII